MAALLFFAHTWSLCDLAGISSSFFRTKASARL